VVIIRLKLLAGESNRAILNPGDGFRATSLKATSQTGSGCEKRQAANRFAADCGLMMAAAWVLKRRTGAADECGGTPGCTAIAPPAQNGPAAIACEANVPMTMTSTTISATPVTWNPERVTQLRTYIGAGLTCSQIAAEIGVSRNAVIGKIHRLGLGPGRSAATVTRVCSPRPQRPQVPSQRQMLRVLTAEAPRVADDTILEAPTVESTQGCSLLELGHGKCRWPVSERGGSAADFIFCGSDAASGFSYCAAHARMAYRKPERRRA
jgi:GcrA cell cycle regulator